jgi:hypothetical protein
MIIPIISFLFSRFSKEADKNRESGTSDNHDDYSPPRTIPHFVGEQTEDEQMRVRMIKPFAAHAFLSICEANLVYVRQAVNPVPYLTSPKPCPTFRPCERKSLNRT